MTPHPAADLRPALAGGKPAFPPRGRWLRR